MESRTICDFHLRGECRYGAQCRFMHADESQSMSVRNQAMRETSRRCLARRISKVSARVAQGDQRSDNNLITLIGSYRNYTERPDQHTVTAPTNTLNAQLEVRDLWPRPSQSYPSIAPIRIRDAWPRPSQSTSTSTNSTNASTAQVQAQELQLQLEESTRPILTQADNSKIAMEMVGNKLSVAIKTGNGNSEKETASNFLALHQKKMKESTENHGSVWDDILLSAIDSDLLCNICFEIFIKPTVLNCSHTFCESCIYVWTDRVIACPICRVEVTSKSYCLTLESFIEKIVEHLPKEIKDKREVAIKDRINIKIERRQPVIRSMTTFNANVRVYEPEIVRTVSTSFESTSGGIPIIYVAEQNSNRRASRDFSVSTQN